MDFAFDKGNVWKFAREKESERGRVTAQRRISCCQGLDGCVCVLSYWNKGAFCVSSPDFRGAIISVDYMFTSTTELLTSGDTEGGGEAGQSCCLQGPYITCSGSFFFPRFVQHRRPPDGLHPAHWGGEKVEKSILICWLPVTSQRRP